MPDPLDLELTVWRCDICGYLLDDTNGQWRDGHEDPDSDDPDATTAPNCSGFAWDAIEHEPNDMTRRQYVPAPTEPQVAVSEVVEALRELRIAAEALIDQPLRSVHLTAERLAANLTKAESRFSTPATPTCSCFKSADHKGYVPNKDCPDCSPGGERG